MAVLAHPDDESLGFGGTLARYAAEGVETALVTATRGQGGRFLGHAHGSPEHPGRDALGRIRELELRNAAAVLGVCDVTVLDYEDQSLDRADPGEAVAALVRQVRRVKPHVVMTFAPDGGYGHPDHIAVSQFATAATVAAADPAFGGAASGLGPPHAVSKLYYMAWSAATWAAYEAAFRKLISTVDGVARQATPWPDWAITTVIDTEAWWPTIWQAVSCHHSQVAAYERLGTLTPEHHRALWGTQSFYRALSLVNGGRQRESDLFEGVSGSGGTQLTQESGQ
jgi:LmbE family N-acetylglucosaminyl deacetylase